MLKDILANCSEEIDLTDNRQTAALYETVKTIIDEGVSIAEIGELESELLKEKVDAHIFRLLALKLAVSKMLTKKIEKPLIISVVFAVYKEHNRIKNSSQHPHGEDFLLKKVDQLNWLFQDQPNTDWELIVVDDGCPEKSGVIAQEIIDKNGLNDKVKILFLSEAIATESPTVQQMTSTSESQKGGSIVYGMWSAVEHRKAENHIVVYTDADLSTHLGQLMLLIEPLLYQNKLVAIGSRREPRSVVIKKGVRNDRGKLFIYLWKRMIPNLGSIVDTQCGFKAFRAEIIPDIIEDMIEKKFAFDIELLLRTSLRRQNAIEKVPIAWIDSEEASTTTDLQPYLPMLKAIAAMSQKYFPEGAKTNEFIQFVNSLNDTTFNTLLNTIPTAIVSREPDTFTNYDKVKVGDFIRSIKME